MFFFYFISVNSFFIKFFIKFCFVFEFSTPGSSWTPMFTVNDGDTNAFYYPSLTGISGTVYVRVADTDRSPGNAASDTIYVDEMFFLSSSGGMIPALPRNSCLPTPQRGLRR